MCGMCLFVISFKFNLYIVYFFVGGSLGLFSMTIVQFFTTLFVQLQATSTDNIVQRKRLQQSKEIL